MLRIGIVAGEASGDLLAADLIKSIKHKYPDSSFEGVGGPLMQAAGCNLLLSYEKLAVIGLFEVAGRYFELLGIRNKLSRYFLNNPPDIFIGIDAPDFNIGLEHSLHEKGIKTVHYVSPSIWAWRSYRVKKIKKSIDLMLVLFPFETQIYQNNKIPVEYVGHPLADQIELNLNKNSIRNQMGISGEDKLVALMPGSRQSELTRMLPLHLETARLCYENRTDLGFICSVLNKETAAMIRQKFEEKFSDYPEASLRLYINQTRDVLTVADAGLLTSGTVTLEAMLCALPMAVAYKINWLSAKIIRSMAKVQFAALPNLLAGREIVKEFLQNDCIPHLMASEILNLLESNETVHMTQIFNDIHRSLKNNASDLAADAVIALSKSTV